MDSDFRNDTNRSLVILWLWNGVLTLCAIIIANVLGVTRSELWDNWKHLYSPQYEQGEQIDKLDKRLTAVEQAMPTVGKAMRKWESE